MINPSVVLSIFATIGAVGFAALVFIAVRIVRAALSRSDAADPSDQADEASSARGAAGGFRPVRYFPGDIELHTSQPIIFDCAPLVYAHELGLDRDFGINIVVETPTRREDLYLIDKAASHLSRSATDEELKRGKLCAAIVPRAAFKHNPMVRAHSTDIYVTSTFVGSCLLTSDPALREKLDGCGGSIENRFTVLSAHVEALIAAGTGVEVLVYDHAGEAFVKNLFYALGADAGIVESICRKPDRRDNVDLVRDLGPPTSSRQKYRFGMATGPALAMAAQFGASAVWCTADSERIVANQQISAFRSKLHRGRDTGSVNRIAPALSAVHTSMCINLPRRWLIEPDVGAPALSEHERRSSETAAHILARLYPFAVELTHLINRNERDFAEFLVRSRHALSKIESVGSHVDLQGIDLNTECIHSALQASYRFTQPGSYFSRASNTKYYWTYRTDGQERVVDDIRDSYRIFRQMEHHVYHGATRINEAHPGYGLGLATGALVAATPASLSNPSAGTRTDDGHADRSQTM